ncbi:MAG: NAD(P)/FAD-dependent oxidoreductase [Cyanobacteria bacterium P01_A01_bin.116]
MKNIVIIGAGPAGLLLAHYLLSRGGYQVQMYDRRPDPRSAMPSSQRTFPISLQLRGLRAIQAVPGLESALAARGVWSQGAVIHGQKKDRQIDRKSPLLLIDRNELTRVLLETLLARKEVSQLTVTFDCACVGVDLDGQRVRLQRQLGGQSERQSDRPAETRVEASAEERFEAGFEYLVGADGVRSQVRETFVTRGDLHCEQKTISDAYKSLYLPKANADKSIELADDRIHTWTVGQGLRMLMAPQPGDWLHGTFIFPANNNPLAALSTGEAVLNYFQQRSPSLAKLMSLETATALAEKPVSRVVTVKCDRMQVKSRSLLIGDAAHAVSPSVGQGCNASLQDVQVFDQCLNRCADNWAEALPTFSTERLPDVHALRELSDYAFPRSKWMAFEFIFRLMLKKKLGRWLPRLTKPLPMEFLMEGEHPYAEILEETRGWVERVKSSINRAT